MFAFITLALPAAAQNFPALSGRVVDDAQVLSTETRNALTTQLAALEARNTDQVVVATVQSLQGNTVEDYANQLFRRWGLGQAAKNNGILLLIAPHEHKVRIEVGYGLEGTLTDAASKLIIENDLIPLLRAGNFDRAATVGVGDITQVLTGGAADWQQRASVVPKNTNPRVHDLGTIELPPVLGYALAGVIGLVMLGFILIVGLLFVSLIVQFLVWIGVFPKPKARHGGWQWLNYVAPATSGHGSSSSSSSDSSGSFSGGGGSSGGGGASGSW